MTTTTATTYYYIWDVSDEKIIDNIAFTTIAEAIAYGDQHLIYFWKEDNNLYKIREI
jgi:hypothetical protein